MSVLFIYLEPVLTVCEEVQFERCAQNNIRIKRLGHGEELGTGSGLPRQERPKSMRTRVAVTLRKFSEKVSTVIIRNSWAFPMNP